MKTFVVHLKSGQSFLVKAHHFSTKFSSGTHATIPFYKDEKEIDEEIFVYASEVAAIVAAGPESKPPQLPGTTGIYFGQ